jgi:molecular chaperone DnaK
LLAKESGQRAAFHICNVNSHSLGVVATEAKTRRLRNAILIPRNTPLPVDARRIFKTHKTGQRSILVRIVEGESLSPEDCSPLGKCSVRNLPENLPIQTPIEVRFRYEENGRLTVTVRVEGTGHELEHEMQRENSLTQEQLDSWRKYVSGLEPPADRAPTGASLPTQPAPRPSDTPAIAHANADSEIDFEEMIAEALEDE